MDVCARLIGLVACAGVVLAASASAGAQGFLAAVFPEQRRMEIRRPSQLAKARLPRVPAPPTVSLPQPDAEPLQLSLDDAIRIALENSEVVRVLTGAGAASSGSTIYDPAIANTEIDRAQGRFDPAAVLQNDFDRAETPQAGFFPGAPPRVGIEGDRIDQYTMGLGLSQTTITGGTASMGVRTNPLRSTAQGLPLNPQTRSSVDLSFSQPLLEGRGRAVNLAPIELARIDTERSFYQLKGSVEQLVRGVIEAYWALVAARVDVWARQQQVEQGRVVLDYTKKRAATDLAAKGDVWDAQIALANFRTGQIASETNLLRREAALRNILGLPPSDQTQIVPVTPLPTDRADVEWEAVLQTAEQYRPDLIERKLILEADRQQLLLARNSALPRVDATALYRWDGLAGDAPDGTVISSGGGQFTGWQFGIDVSMPLGLRESRAALRQQELLLMRDRANLEQALHNVTHLLAETYRNLAESYEQYQTLTEVLPAAQETVQRRLTELVVGRARLLELRTAIADRGNLLSSQAQTLAEYNAGLAGLQQQTGTILEAHGIRFFEERYCSTGPMGRMFYGRWYPKDHRPGANEPQYGRTSEPAENAFDLKEPTLPRRGELDRRRLRAPQPDARPDGVSPPFRQR
jgi:outer membrane protein TolC